MENDDHYVSWAFLKRNGNHKRYGHVVELLWNGIREVHEKGARWESLTRLGKKHIEKRQRKNVPKDLTMSKCLKTLFSTSNIPIKKFFSSLRENDNAIVSTFTYEFNPFSSSSSIKLRTLPVGALLTSARNLFDPVGGTLPSTGLESKETEMKVIMEKEKEKKSMGKGVKEKEYERERRIRGKGDSMVEDVCVWREEYRPSPITR
uniref:Uncharacterized protein n=1 Tax=Vespula pensylvanica TaxID=30213 RepID=A0A834JTH5_VESPE|nr:hypothetical protein H0235_016909 [Vespula pensylvanica]